MDHLDRYEVEEIVEKLLRQKESEIEMMIDKAIVNFRHDLANDLRSYFEDNDPNSDFDSEKVLGHLFRILEH